MRPAIILLAAILAGCASGSEPASEAPLGPSELERRFSGFLAWRVPGHAVAGCDVAEPAVDGERIAFDIQVPEGVTRLEGSFSWEVPQPMSFQFYDPQDAFPDHEAQGEQGPLTLVADHPVPGIWHVYAGPSAAGGATAWEVVLRWITDHPLDEGDVVAPASC